MRRRYVQRPDGSLVEITGDEPLALPVDSGALWGDEEYRNMRATDGTPIDTRTKHREYMRARGITTVDDFTDAFKVSEQQRERIARGEDPKRRADIIRAIEQRR